MASKAIPTSLLAKLNYQYGRHWGGSMRPDEFLTLVASGDVIARDDERQRAARRVEQNSLSQSPFYFDVKPNSKLESALQKKKPQPHYK